VILSIFIYGFYDIKQLEEFCATSDIVHKGCDINDMNRDLKGGYSSMRSSNDVYGRTLVLGLFHSAPQVMHIYSLSTKTSAI
jgi:hypothetical protein